MAQQTVDDFLTRYRVMCSQQQVCSSKLIPKLVKGTELQCSVESVLSWHWALFLRTLSTDNSLTKVEFSCNLSPSSQKQTSQKLQKIMEKYYPVPYGCTAVNVSNICQAVANMLVHSEKIVDVRLENLHLSKDDILILTDSLSCSKIKMLSFAESVIDDESLELLCRKLYNSKIGWYNFSSCQITGDRLKSVCRLLKHNKNNRMRDMYFLGLRNQTPVLDEMEGISRMTLNNNAIGDEGVEMIVESLEDDFWLKVLDLQKCEIGNAGAQCILKSLKSNVTFQDIDLRQNDIDPSYIEKISLQLSLNNAGQELKYKLGPLWKSRQYTIRNPKRVFRTKKVLKTSPPKLKFLPKKPNSSIETAFKFSHAMLNPKSTNIEDASVQTDILSVFDEELRKIQRTLTNEIKLRECLMHLLKKYKMENCMLRKEIYKLSKLDDHILIDQDTFSEVKNTFEKFKRFLSVMKEYGLFECIAMLGVNENTDIVLKPLILNATKKCMQLVESEPSDEAWFPPPELEAVLSQNGASTCFSQKKTEFEPCAELSQVTDKALVQKVFREVRENYSGGRPSFPPKHGRRPETPLRKRPKDANGRMEAVNKIRQLRSPKEFFYGAKESSEDADKKTASSQTSCSAHHSRKTVEPSTVPTCVHGQPPDGQPKPKGSNPSSAPKTCAHSSLKASMEDGALSEGTCPSDTKLEMTPSARSYSDSTLEKAPSSRSNGTLEPFALSSAASNSSRGTEEKEGSVKSYLESVSDAASTDKDVKSIGESEVYSAPHTLSKVSQNSSVVATKESRNPSGGSGPQNPNDATAKGSQNPNVATVKGSQNPSVATAKGSQNPSATTTKGSENSSAISASKLEQGDAASVDNSSEGSNSKSSKRRRAKKSSSQPLEENLKLKKVGSDSSVPSLSDITTVSSRSLNTDSVMGQISNEEA